MGVRYGAAAGQGGRRGRAPTRSALPEQQAGVSTTVFQIGHSVLVTAGVCPEFDRVKSVLERRGVKGWADFGYLVNRPDLFRPSEVDERAAMPVLLDLLPTLTDGKAEAATARHLRRPWAGAVSSGRRPGRSHAGPCDEKGFIAHWGATKSDRWLSPPTVRTVTRSR